MKKKFKKVGKANLYQINLKNKPVQHLMAFDWNLVKQVVNKEIK